jgi:glucosamine 6-phosphate synthetase-like amidotransferase/phosphosugar isomerase protein
LKEALERLKLENSYSQEKRQHKEDIQRYEKGLAQIIDNHDKQMSHLTEQIERLEDNLRQNKLAIGVAQQDEVRWKEPDAPYL